MKTVKLRWDGWRSKKWICFISSLSMYYEKQYSCSQYLVSDELSTFVSRTKSAKYICLKALKYMSMMPLTVILLWHIFTIRSFSSIPQSGSPGKKTHMTDGRNSLFQPNPCQRFQQLDTHYRGTRNEGRQMGSKDKQGSEGEVRQIREMKWVLDSTRRKDSQLALQEWFPLIDQIHVQSLPIMWCYI